MEIGMIMEKKCGCDGSGDGDGEVMGSNLGMGLIMETVTAITMGWG